MHIHKHGRHRMHKTYCILYIICPINNPKTLANCILNIIYVLQTINNINSSFLKQIIVPKECVEFSLTLICQYVVYFLP